MVSVILDAALSGLKTSQRQLDVTSHNIANVNTPGYHKRALTQYSQSIGGIGQGTVTGNVIRSANASLEAQQLQTTTVVGRYEIQDQYRASIEQIYGKPGSGNSLSDAMLAFKKDLDGFTVAVDNIPPSTVIVGAQVLTNQLNTMSQNIQALRMQADQAVADGLQEANTYIDQLGDLNNKISTGQAVGLDTGDLQDQRQEIVRQLGSLMGIQTYMRADGNMVVSTTTGRVMVDGTKLQKFGQLGAAPGNTLATYTPVTAMTAATPTQRIGLGTIGNPGLPDLTDELITGGGKIGALLGQRGQYSATVNLPQGELQQRTAELNQFALQLYNTLQATNLNTTDVAANPVYDPTNAVNQANHFFAGVYPNPPANPGNIDNAATIAVHPDLIANASLLNTTSGGIDVSIARNLDTALNTTNVSFAAAGALGAIQTTFIGYSSTVLNNVADLRLASKTGAQYNSDLLTNINTRLGDVSGVNLDEELSNLIVYQKSYQASAKTIQTANEMLDVVLNLKR
jgi:flagellar hook-associated protein 1 FlgK